MTDYTPRRRGRPPMARESDTPAVEAESAEKAPTRRRRPSTGGFNQKLKVPERAGFHRRWFNDEPGRLAYAQEMAYDFVTDRELKSDSPDNRVRRFVGTTDGTPLYAYLMETPLEEFQRGQMENREKTLTADAAIVAGRDMDGRIDNQYGRGSIG